MNNLPPEVLCEIFMESLEKQPFSFSQSILAPLHISHVCRTWRHLSLSYRELWSYLYISMRSPRKQEAMVEVFDTWMARSNDGPLNFEILFLMDSRASVESHRRAEYILTTLIENQHRWKAMSFFCSGVSFSSRFQGFKLTHLPLLTSLRLSLDQSASAKADFTNSSRLPQSTIQHNNFNLLTDGILPRLKWICLDFCLQEDENAENTKSTLLGLKLLRSSPFMRYLDITTYYSTVESLSPIVLDGGPILHTCLNELSLSGWRGSELPAAIIDVLTLPSLQRLRYLNHVGNEKLLRFFQRSTPPLTELCMSWRDSREETLIDILRLLSSLKKLDIYGKELSDWFFRELIVPSGMSDNNSATRERVVCPILSSFGIGEISSDTSCLDSVQTMAKSRSSVFGTLETASFYNKHPPTPSHIRRGCPDRTVAVIDLDKYSGYIDPNRGLTLR